MRVFEKKCIGYNRSFAAYVEHRRCEYCGIETDVLILDGSDNEYYNGQYCEACIKKFFEIKKQTANA